MLARQVREVRVAVEEVGGLGDDAAAVEQLVRGESLQRAAGDVPHRVAAAARRGDAGAVEVGEDVRQLAQREPVQLDVLTRRELGVAAAVAVRHLADRAQLGRGQLAARQLDAEHERADLRLVVVQPPPLQADDVLLGDALVALRDQGGELIADPERILLLLQAFDRIPLEDEVPRRGRLFGAHRRILQ